MTRRQLLSDRIHELNRGLEEEGGEFEDGEGEGGFYHQAHRARREVQLRQHDHIHHKPNRIMFDEDSNRFAQLAASRAMGFRIQASAQHSLSDEDDDDARAAVNEVQEKEEEDDEEDDDFYFDEQYDDCDVDESTTLRKPTATSGQVKKIVNR